ncbi:cobalt-precorrin-5B (C1)-methyltransferase [Ectothiorhodospira mobilis]|uniref:Cobalt-precorrin-5B C(1)-methyltransferase n=1 Tax=Ectothiorhodospira mobilis TaxID=195064 RepID=A0A1I4RKL7_ECTMO|nr:cobalt-precorrin-5B (C(1))-methyltransferase [Ectothiorhodospira mobilis]SFM52761.1 cobalt-precorrin-5B (C1)-methyltransferase [Ectothiorhodospira mobilis]
MSDQTPSHRPQGTALRRGWTTGACATAATKAAFSALAGGGFPDPVRITLPKGLTPAFSLAMQERGEDWARAGVVKDAGDDPDVTHGALVQATVRRGPPGSGVRFCAGEGVGQVTRAGLPVAIGEPAINPSPRAMMRRAVEEIAAQCNVSGDVLVEISIPGGEGIAADTLNPRLGILGGLSILGTTGVVVPFSCSAWIHAIQRGIDVARAAGLEHVAGSTGRTSEKAVQAHHALPDAALIDMGDFIGGMLKYLRTHPVPRITVAGGMAKITKLSQGFMDVHSRRGQADLGQLARLAATAGADPDCQARIAASNTVAEAFGHAQEAGVSLGDAVARAAHAFAQGLIDPQRSRLEILIFDRAGQRVGRAGFMD